MCLKTTEKGGWGRERSSISLIHKLHVYAFVCVFIYMWTCVFMCEVDICGQPSSTALDTTKEVSMYFCRCGTVFPLCQGHAGRSVQSSEARQPQPPRASPPKPSNTSPGKYLQYSKPASLCLWGPVEGRALGVKWHRIELANKMDRL